VYFHLFHQCAAATLQGVNANIRIEKVAYHASGFAFLWCRLIAVIQEIVIEPGASKEIRPSAACGHNQPFVPLANDINPRYMVRQSDSLWQPHGLGFVGFEDGGVGHASSISLLDIFCNIRQPKLKKSYEYQKRKGPGWFPGLIV
jgi:hypothetical protein